MSWDILIQDFPEGARSIEEIPDDFSPGPVGRRADLVRMIREAVPEVDFADPSVGKIKGEGFHVDIALGEDEEVKSIMLFVHGGGGAAAATVSKIVGRLKLSAFDFGSGDFFDPECAGQGFERWQKYRDQINGDVKG